VLSAASLLIRRMFPPRSTSSFSKCGSGSAPNGSGLAGSEMSKVVRPADPVTNMTSPRNRAPITPGCGIVPTRETLSETRRPVGSAEAEPPERDTTAAAARVPARTRRGRMTWSRFDD
jgi:hypothetical protein